MQRRNVSLVANDTAAEVSPPTNPPIPGLLVNDFDATDPSRFEPRLCAELANVAGRPIDALRAAVATSPTNLARGRAFADLAVTGRAARAAYLRETAGGVDLVELLGGTDLAKRATARDVLTYVDAVLEYLPLSTSERKASALTKLVGTTALPWLACFAELDAPHHPVNVGVTSFVQKEVRVPFRGRDVTTRYVMHGQGPVILFLHGLGSRLEESDAVRKALEPKGYTLVALDLVGHGYTERVAPSSVGASSSNVPDWRNGASFVFLTAMDEFVTSFTKALGIDKDIRIITGGSLGGTLTLRQAILDQASGSKRRYLPWSPASCWESLQKFEVLRRGAEDRVGRRLRTSEKRVWDLTTTPAREDTRFDCVYFNFVERIPTVGPTCVTWWSDEIGKKKKDAHIWSSRLDRREQLDDAMRKWTLALAYEQTFFSFVERGPDNVRRLDRIRRGVYIVVGDDDRSGQLFAGTDIAGSVERLVNQSPAVAGFISTLPKTGHSIHDERPQTLAQLLIDLDRAPTMTG